ncbi:hypothetical protein [Bradyrhizobium sp. RT11b]
MLDQHWLFFADITDMADDDLKGATILAAVDLRRFAPTAIK